MQRAHPQWIATTSRVVCCLLALAFPVLAQPVSRISDDYIHRSWGTGDGLPQNSVTAILQTRDGYLWLGTFGGLVRFDGNAFTVFDPGNTPGLASGRIVALREDRLGRLWIGTETGLTRFESGRFTSYTTRDGLPQNGILALLEDRQGRMWIATGGGVVRYDGKTFSPVPLDPLSDPAVVDVIESADGDVWAATWNGVARFNNAGDATFFKHGEWVNRRLLIDASGDIWMGADTLARWDGQRFVDVPLPISRDAYGRIDALAANPGGGIWIGTARAGLLHFKDGAFSTFDDRNGLPDNHIRSLRFDRDDNLWIGTDVGGLIRLKPRQVDSYQRPGAAEQSLGPIVDDGDGGLWIGATCGGLLHFRDARFRVYEMKDGLPHNCIWALHRDDDGTLWIGSMGGGVTRLRHGRFDTFGTAHGLTNLQVHAIERDHAGVLWVGTNDGVSRLVNGRFTNFRLTDGLPETILTITPDRRGLWLGGPSGLVRFEQDRVIARYTTENGLSHNHVRAIYEDADGVLWIGTYGGGLNRFKDGRFTTYGIKEGLFDVAVSRIIEDEHGNLWMSGNKGVYHVARRELNEFAEGRRASITSISYGTADGMIIAETNGGQPAGWHTSDGRFWFPTIKGLVSIEPNLRSTPPPPLFVEQVIANGEPFTANGRTEIGRGRADAEFHYTAVELSAAEKTRFRYRLVGYDAGWIDAGTRRIAYYTNIPPGRYRFEVAATDVAGTWTNSPAAMNIVVAPFWWQRRGAQFAGLLLLLIATGFTVRFVSLRRARARVAELERERAIDRERSRIARDLHDDLGSRLAQIAFIAQAPDAQHATGRITTVAREAIQTMDELVWTVNARNDTVERFAEYVAEFAEEHLTLANLRCRLHIQTGLDDVRFDADARRHVYLAFKEALHNVVKHAAASEVHITLDVADGMLMLDVADDGRGFDQAPSATGNGLRNMGERMAAAGGNMTVESRPGGGTRLRLRVPVGARGDRT